MTAKVTSSPHIIQLREQRLVKICLQNYLTQQDHTQPDLVVLAETVARLFGLSDSISSRVYTFRLV